MTTSPPGLEAWIESVPAMERSDPIWRNKVYRLARYAAATAGDDAASIRASPLRLAVGDQLLRAVLSIAANIAEGYSRSSGRDRARFLEYALGSAREAIVWYEGTRSILGAPVDARLELLVEIRRLLLAMIQADRARMGISGHDTAECGVRSEVASAE